MTEPLSPLPPAPRRPAAPPVARLFVAAPPAITDPALLAAYAALMTPEERAQEARFHFEEHRHAHRVTRALARTVLSRYTSVAPADLRFQTGPYGRPDIDPPREGLSWNLSHTAGLVVCLVAEGVVCGVDVEDVAGRRAPLDVANRFFSPAEVTALFALPAEARHRRFFELWTLKESYIKARGMGLALPLEGFALDPAAAPISIAFPGVDDDPRDWQFALLAPTPRHLVAAAFRRGAGPDWSVEVHEVVPLAP